MTRESFIRQNATVVHHGYLDLLNKSDFNPTGTLTRAEFSKWLALGMKLEINKNENPLFNDMSGYEEYIPYVNAIKKINITGGIGSGRFSPGNAITLIDAVAMIVVA